MYKSNSKLKRKNNGNVPEKSTSPEDSEDDTVEDEEEDDGFFNIIEDEDADTSDSDSEIEEESEDEELSEDYVDNSSETSEEEEENNEEESDGEDEALDEETEEDTGDSEDVESEETDNEDQSDNDNINSNENEEQKIEKIINNDEEIGKFVKIKTEEINSDSRNDQNMFRTKSKTKDAINTRKQDEYADHDTSDEEDIRNTVGNIPMKWYNDYKHLGYDWDGKPIIKPETGDKIDDFLKRMENPEFWRTVKDPQTGQDVVLGDEDIQLIKRIQAQKIPDVSFEEYAVSIM
ncbi:hypothetical protein AMK59_5564 [Oryctes borbonicus]|uniref:BOP1 N-terminal domain-containing protein n=1 Tax=Oryctes borbonicus TaxID=1629725 RepID=A0A0T6B0U6_9SCAR|nr:hypothetical protein AMK59_5564 [Oryctes borbonicus]